MNSLNEWHSIAPVLVAHASKPKAHKKRLIYGANLPNNPIRETGFTRKINSVSTDLNIKNSENYTFTDPEYYSKIRFQSEMHLMDQAISDWQSTFEGHIALDSKATNTEFVLGFIDGYTANEIGLASWRKIDASIGLAVPSPIALRDEEIILNSAKSLLGKNTEATGIQKADPNESRDLTISGRTLGAVMSIFAVAMCVPSAFSSFYVLHPALALAVLICGVTFVAMSYAQNTK